MKKIGLFYGTSTRKTASVAKNIAEAFGEDKIDLVPIEKAWQKEFEQYDNLIVGSSTWFDGELPDYWDEMLPQLETMKMKGKKVAIFGLGNQVEYPDNFVDGIGILADVFESAGAQLVGFIPNEGYKFNRSRALRGNQFAGLVLDLENEADKTDQRIQDWVKMLQKEFE